MLRSLLNTLPSWLLLVLVVGGTVAIGLLAERRQRRRHRGDETPEMLTLTFEFVGIAYAILVGFVIVSVWETQQEARSIVQEEGATLEDMVDVERVIDGSGDDLHIAISKYIDATIDDEFEDSLKDGEHTQSADDAADGILDAIVRMEPVGDVDAELRSTVLSSYTEFRDLRTERNDLANQRIAGELWLLVLVSSFAVVRLVASFTGRGHWDIAATTVVSTTVGLVLYALAALSYPFSGDVSVDPAPLRDVLHEIARENGTR